MDEDVDLLQQMWADFKSNPSQHFYIKEIARLHSGQLVIPMKWICVVEETGTETFCADVFTLERDSLSGHMKMDQSKYTRISCTELEANYLQLQEEGSVDFTFAGECIAPLKT